MKKAFFAALVITAVFAMVVVPGYARPNNNSGTTLTTPATESYTAPAYTDPIESEPEPAPTVVVQEPIEETVPEPEETTAPTDPEPTEAPEPTQETEPATPDAIPTEPPKPAPEPQKEPERKPTEPEPEKAPETVKPAQTEPEPEPEPEPTTPATEPLETEPEPMEETTPEPDEYETDAEPSFESDVLIWDTGIPVEVLEQTQAYYDMLPASVRARFDEEKWHIYVTYGMSAGAGDYAGYCDQSKKLIFLSNDPATLQTVIHEMGHFVDCLVVPCNTDEFVEAWSDESSNLTQFWDTGYQNISFLNEYYAETFMLYVLHPDLLAAHCPRTFAYFAANL